MVESLLFSHVWEDPAIELSLIEAMQKKQKKIKMLMVCSGGDTLIHILNHYHYCTYPIEIDVIDSNKLQIALTVLKLFLWNFLNTDKSVTILNGLDEKWMKYENILSGDYQNYEHLIDFLFEKYKHLDFAHFILMWKKPENMKLLEKGVVFAGQLEQTFSNLIASDMNFETIFNDETLSNKFGSASIELSRKKSFGQRFKDIYQTYVDLHGNNFDENRFYHRLQFGTETIQFKKTLFENPNLDLLLSNIHFICDDMFSFVAKTEQKDKYDLIQTSNVTDWLETKENVSKFVSHVHRICAHDGVSLWRSLNGDYDFQEIINQEFKDNQQKKCSDSSHFYKLVLICQKHHLFKNQEEIMDFVSDFVNLETIINENIYFKNLAQNTMSIEKFLHSQIPFFYAVEHWVVVLEKVLDKLICAEEFELAVILNDNINDELGKNANQKHTSTFVSFLFCILHKKLNFVNQLDFYTAKHIADFNNGLDCIVKEKSLAYVCAYLGTIEYQYVFISKIIKEFSDKNDIQQEHYQLHEVLDTKHALDLYQIAAQLQTDIDEITNASQNAKIDFMQLYCSMHM